MNPDEYSARWMNWILRHPYRSTFTHYQTFPVEAVSVALESTEGVYRGGILFLGDGQMEDLRAWLITYHG